MTELHPEQNSDKRSKIFVGIIAALALLLAFQTGYMLNLNKRNKEDEKNKSLYAQRQSEPAAWTHQNPDHRRNFSHASSYFDEWDPFSEIERMQDQMDRMFAQTLRNVSSMGAVNPVGATAFFEPDIDVQDKKDHYLIKVDLPGMEKDQVRVEVRNNILTIAGERKSENKQEDKDQGYYRMERSYGSFHRQIPLPSDVKEEGVSAQYNNGVLTVKILRDVNKKNPAEISKPVMIE